MLEAGFRPVGRDFPVFLHPQTHEEYALARTERKSAPGYHGFQFHAAPDVSGPVRTLRAPFFHDGERDLDTKVRKINGPAAEPIDLMDVSGTSILKRAAPAIAALLIILFFLRRRS